MASGNISCTVMMNPLPAPGHPRGGSSERWKGQQRILDRICCCPRHFVYESSLHLAGIELAMSASTRRAAGTAPAASAGAAHQQHQQEQQHCTNRARILPESSSRCQKRSRNSTSSISRSSSTAGINSNASSTVGIQ